jgi:molybdopterin-containing oxidoreductase family iron-sulfur binding subunit
MSSVKNDQPKYWRSLAELQDSPEFRKFVEHEFSEPVSDTPPSSPARRRFMQLMGASFALSGATGCRWEEDHVLPYTRRPEGLVPGVPKHFSTSMDVGGYAVGLRVKSYDGRPIKIEGNPAHPDSRGAATVYHQASVLELYDPDRSKVVVTGSGADRTETTWLEIKTLARGLMADQRTTRGAGLRVLSEASSSPSLADMKRRFIEAYPMAKWYE